MIEETLGQIFTFGKINENHGEDRSGPLFNSPTFFRWGNLARYFLVIFETQPSHDSENGGCSDESVDILG